MDQIFLKVINMSITASYVILFLILIRLFIRKLPKIYSYSLWIIVLIRLLVPFSFPSLFSMVPANGEAIPKDIIYEAKPEIHSGISQIDRVVNNSLPKAIDGASINPIQIWLFIGEIIWLAGILILLIYSVISTLKLLRALRPSKHLKSNIYITNFAETPFVFGVLRPKIYIPFSLSIKEQSYIIRHEETHIERYDHIIKFAFHISKIIHWFNPLVWLAFTLMSKDMELSCDEKVIKEMGNEIKKDYSHSLLSISSDRKIIGNSPLAFGGENTKGRIKNILDYKKPRFWASMLGIIVIVVSVIGLLTNPKPRGIVMEEEILIKDFIENYYGQLAYTKEEQSIIKEEIDEILELGKVTREDSFYHFYEQALTPELYKRMVRNRLLPNLYMVEIGYDEIKVSNMELSKDKEVIRASFDLECYISGESIEEERISLDFKLKEIKDKLYIDSIDGDLSYRPSIVIGDLILSNPKDL